MTDTLLAELLIPGTEPSVAARYATLKERARDAVFGAFEEDVVVLDTETTGLSFEHDTLIEVAAARLNGNKILERYTSLINPGRHITEAITALTGIDDSMVADAPPVAVVLSELNDFIGKTAIVAHNASFDQAMIAAAEPPGVNLSGQNQWCDSLELAHICLPRLRDFRLEALSDVFADAGSSHRAGDDVTALCQIWRVLLVALSDLPAGLPALLAELFSDSDWPLRPFISQVAGMQSDVRFSLSAVRRSLYKLKPVLDKSDAVERFNVAAATARAAPAPAASATDTARAAPAASAANITPPFPLELARLAKDFTSEGLLGRMYPDFEARDEQIAMAEAVADALNSSRHLVVEAGTGVGKSMAYLLPLARFARQNGICCGVATKTNTLLDQLLYHELPRLAETLPDGLAFESLKGYDHYPCLRKLMNLTRENSRRLPGSSIATIATLLSYVSQSPRGDLDYLRLHFDQISRHELVASADDCLKRKCRYYSSCLLHGARKQAAEADIVLTNQALLFCDVMAEGGILPPVRHWVIDEAHGTEAEARQQLSSAVNAREVLASLDALLGARGQLARLRDAVRLLDGGSLLAGKIEGVLADAAVTPTICTSFFSELKELELLAERSDYDQLSLWINAEVRESAPWGMLYTTGASFLRALERLVKACQDVVALANQFAEVAELQGDVAGSTAELNQCFWALTLILNGDDSDYVYSAELDRRAEMKTDSLLAQRLDVGAVLAERFLPEALSVIFTSATLATGSGFDYFANTCGLDVLQPAAWQSLKLDSSYDFERNMAVYLPNDLPEPNAAGYLAALEEMLFGVHQALGGSVLTLFTNRRDMEKLFGRLRPRLSEIGLSLRCQWRGQNSRRLSEEFLKDRELSLFALRSFWQGFDAPGDTLRCVVVPKLPFGRPTDPLSQERSLRVRDAWKRYVLPEAVIDLKQAAGRLIRSSSDRGALILADSRLSTKWYGKEFLAALPSQQRYTLSSEEMSQALQGY